MQSYVDILLTALRDCIRPKCYLISAWEISFINLFEMDFFLIGYWILALFFVDFSWIIALFIR